MQITPVSLIADWKFLLDLKGYLEIYAVFQILFIYLFIYLLHDVLRLSGWERNQYREKGAIN